MARGRSARGEGLLALLAINEVWAIEPRVLEGMADAMALAGRVPTRAVRRSARASGARVSAESLLRARGSFASAPGVAVIPIRGPLVQHGSRLLELFFGATSTDRIGEQIDAAAAESRAQTIVLDIDSPGGSVFGVTELAAAIFAARRRKRIIAVANSTAASAAYWIGSQANEFVVTPGGEAGSVGVLALHIDHSEQNKMLGVDPTFVYAGRFKTEGNPDEPLGDSARAFMQKRVNEYYAMFLGDVARGRRTTPAAVRSGFGQGRMLGASEAVASGLADRIATLDQVVFAARSRRRPSAFP